MTAKKYYLHANNVYTETSIEKDCYVLIKDGKIVDICHSPQTNIPVVELGSLNLLPGFLDLHIHGREGADVMDATPAAIETNSTSLAKHGVVGF